MDAKQIRQWLKKGLVAFVFDGFDEVIIENRQAFLDWICDIQISVDCCPVILTSRPLTSGHLKQLDEKWHKWQLEPFDKARIVEYIQRWHTHTPLSLDAENKIEPTKLVETWQKDPVIAPLTSNPLLLSTLLMVHHLDGRLPTGRAKLYERYIEGMLGLWDDRRNVSTTITELTLPQKRQVLQRFALHMHFQGIDSIEEEEALNLFAQICEDLKLKLSAPEVLDLLRERSGLIVGPGVYNFAHKSIGEFLVAECVVQGNIVDPSGKRLDRMTLLERRDDDRWNTIIFLWAGMAPVAEVESFIVRSNELKCYALAYGVLADQYERFGLDFKKQLLLDMNSTKLELNNSSHGTIYYCGATLNRACGARTKTIDLRGLVGIATYTTCWNSLSMMEVYAGQTLARSEGHCARIGGFIVWVTRQVFII